MKTTPQGIIKTKIYEQYFLQKIFGPFLLITVVVTGIAWLSQSLRFIDLIVNKGLSIGAFFYLSALILPSLMWVIIPMATFISIVYGYNKLSGDSELVIFRSIGVNTKALMRPAIIFCVFTTLLSFAISFYFLPASYRIFKDTQINIRNNYASILLQPGIFVSPTNGVTVYVKEKDKLGVLKGLIVYDNRNKNKRYTITAQEAELEETPKGPVFILRNGSHQEYNNKTGKYSLLYFKSYNLEMDLFNNEMTQNRARESQELYLHELFTGNNGNPKDRLKQISEANYRITWPLYNFLMCLMALMPFIKGEFSRHGYVKRIGRISMIAIAVVISALALKGLTQKNIYLNILMYINVIGGIIIAYRYLVSDKARH